MKIGKQLFCGKDVLWLETENEGEAELVKDFARSNEPLFAKIHYDDGFINPLIIIEKETN